MIFEICVGIVVIVCVGLIIYILAKQSGPISIDKTTDSGNTNLVIKANRDIKSIELNLTNESEGPVFRRQNIKSGEVVQFVFPQTNDAIIISVTDNTGTHTQKA